MVKIAIAGASSQLAREVLDKLADTRKHEIIALIRKNPQEFPVLQGVRWVQTTYGDKDELVRLLDGVHTLLCFFAVHLDPGGENQKRLIDASVEAGVARYVPSEWSTGTALATATDVMPWYAGKVEIVQYLENLNKEGKVLEYTKFQPGSFMNYLGHPHASTKHISTLLVQFDFENQRAIVVEGSVEDEITYTTVDDISSVVARAVEYEGEWPVTGGIRGSQVTIGEVLKIGERIGKPFAVEWLKMDDLVKGELKTNNYTRLNLPSIPKDQVEAFSQMATRGILIAIHRGVWAVSDEWNQLLPDYKFTQVEEFLRGLWARE